MKTLLILTLCFILVKSNSQTIPANASVAISTGWSTFYINAPMVIVDSHGEFKITGDSLTAIKLLWKELERRDKDHDERYFELWREYEKVMDFIRKDEIYHKRIDKFMATIKADIKKTK